MFKGKTQCDGQIIETRCANCLLVTRGVPEILAGAVANTPKTIADKVAKSPGIGSLFSGRGSVRSISLGLQTIAATVDRIVVVSQWQKEVMLRNAIPTEKVVCLRAGVDPEISKPEITSKETFPSPDRRTNSPLRIGFLGRVDPKKGIHIIVDALLKIPNTIPFSLRALLIDEGIYTNYLKDLRIKIGDSFVSSILINQPRSVVSEFFKNIDVLAVPSQWLETGPLVVLESRAWNVPVIGSNLGGIAELVRHMVDGLLIPHADVDAWADAFVKLAQEPKLLDTLRSNITPVRTMRETGHETLKLFESVLQERRPSIGETTREN